MCKLCIVQACCNSMCKDRMFEMFKDMPDMNHTYPEQYSVKAKTWVVRVDSNT